MYRPLLALLLIPAACGVAGDTPLERATLRGLKAISLVVDPLDQELMHDGLSAAAFRNRMEDRLRQANIPIDANAHEFLGLHIASVRAKRTPVAMSLTLALYQPVVLARDPKIRTATITWTVETVMMSPGRILQSSATDSLDELLDAFIRAYHSAN